MGVCGVGKSTVARRLAGRLGASFIEADDYHSEASVSGMREGRPLADAERWGWLSRLVTAAEAIDGPVVIACSALKHSYREALRQGLGRFQIVHLTAEKSLLEERMGERTDHFMPATLLDSQFADLEPPRCGEEALTLEVTEAPDILVDRAEAFVRGHLNGSTPDHAL